MKARFGFANKVCLAIDLYEFDRIVRPDLEALRRSLEFHLKFLLAKLFLSKPRKRNRRELLMLCPARVRDSFRKEKA